MGPTLSTNGGGTSVALGRWIPWLNARARGMVGARLGARLSPESLAQQAALVYWRNRAKVAGYDTRHLAGWLTGVLRRCLMARLAAGRARPEMEPLAGDPADAGTAVEEDFLRAELHRMLLDAVDQLEDLPGQVLRLHRFEGLSHAEIAGRLGITANHSAVLHHRAIKQLGKLLAGPGLPR